MDLTKKKIAVSILSFLQDSLASLSADDRESLEVSMDCIRNSFGVNESDASLQSANSLVEIFTEYSKAKEVDTTATATATATTSAPTVSNEEFRLQILSEIPDELLKSFDSFCEILQNKGAFNNPTTYQAILRASKDKFFESKSKEIKAAAEKIKNEGNSKLQNGDYQGALESYTKAIKYDDSNAIYYANRAACYTALSDAENAISDSNSAIERNPNYAKAYARLGSAYTLQKKHQEALDAYKSALKLEPNNESFKASVAAAEKQISGGSAGGVGGMPDLSGIDFNNLGNTINQMGGINGLMENPLFKNMYNSVMQNPEMLNSFLNPDMMNKFQNAMGKK